MILNLICAMLTGIVIGWGLGLAVADRSFRGSK